MNEAGQGGGLFGLFQFVLMFLIFSVIWFQIAADLITNNIAPVLGVQQYGATGLLIFRIGAFLMWSAILPLGIMAALQGRNIDAT